MTDPKPLNDVADVRGAVVYVVTVVDQDRLESQQVFASLFGADERYREQAARWGAAACCLTSRRVE